MDSYTTPIDDVDHLRRSYKLFALNHVRLPADIGSTDLDRVDSLIHDKRLLERGKTLFRQGDASDSLYVVRSGSLKTIVGDPAGGTQVLGFHLPGDIVGVGGLGRDHYLGSAEALERSYVWSIPHPQLLQILSQIPDLNRQLLEIAGKWVNTNLEHLVIMGKLHARERLAMFLRSFASRYERLSRDPTNLLLPMSRRDLANYLGLAMETVSRQFGCMETEGILVVDCKKVHILRPDLLADMCGDDQPMTHNSHSNAAS
ncbi:MAG: cyclic nucleotide-binding domain-containing protein [Candidimonas sp.]|nr:MAG: cyclic nucleotide-binding domain-containing protein [Candidimonas sp.]TAM21912.1 MAG: cyclic nucleotide-binding domain-containing protein [Candidimonas sp.]